jgi:ribosomal protein S27AE
MERSRDVDRLSHTPTERGIVREEAGSLFTVALVCPSCGGALSFAEGNTRVVCDHCGLAHMVVGKKGDLRYVIPNRISRGAATAQANRLIGGVDRREEGAARHIDSRLVYVPFFRVSVAGGGWYIGQADTVQYAWHESGDQQQVVIPHEAKKRIMEGFFRELTYFTAAVDVSDFGLIGIWAKSMVLELSPFDGDALGEGSVFSPLKERETAAREAWATVVAAARPAGLILDYIEAEKVTEEIALIYYPVWVVRFLVNGAPRRAAVDGIGGDVIYARISKTMRTSALPGVLVLAIVVFLATTSPFALALAAAACLFVLSLKGWNWLWATVLRLFVFPWKTEEVIIG